MKNKTTALLEILLANAFWGAGFFATIWALKDLSPAAVVFYRFFVAGVASILLFLFAQYFFYKAFNLVTALRSIFTSIKLSVPAGLSLGATMLLQTWGLLTTSAGMSAFITVLYVVITPFLEILFFKRKLKFSHWLAVVISLFGISLMTNVATMGFSTGDLLTLGCAFTAALHIIYIGKYAQNKNLPKGPGHLFLANAGQAIIASLMTLPLILLPGSWNLMTLGQEAFIGMMLLTFGSSLIAFYLQLRAQRDINSSEAAVLYLLESPFSAIYGFFILGEILNSTQLVGAALIMLGCLVAIQGHKFVARRAR